MTRDPDHDDESGPGGRAAERLRQHLQARFSDTDGDETSPLPEAPTRPSETVDDERAEPPADDR